MSDSDVVSIGLTNGIFSFSYPHFKPAADVSLAAEISSDLINWTPALPNQIVDNGLTETARVQENLATNAIRFFRLRAELP